MSTVEQTSTNRTYITLVVVVLLCAAGLLYSQGWLNWSRSSYQTESNKAGTGQTIDQVDMKPVAVPATPSTTEPEATPAK